MGLEATEKFHGFQIQKELSNLEGASGNAAEHIQMTYFHAGRLFG